MVWHPGCHPRPHESMEGSRLNAKKSLFLYYRGPLFRSGEEFDTIVGTSVSCSYWFYPHICEQDKARPVTHCQTLLRLLGLTAAVSSGMHFGLLYMRPLQWMAQDQGVSLSTGASYFGDVEEALVLVSGSKRPRVWRLCKPYNRGIPIRCVWWVEYYNLSPLGPRCFCLSCAHLILHKTGNGQYSSMGITSMN